MVPPRWKEPVGGKVPSVGRRGRRQVVRYTRRNLTERATLTAMVSSEQTREAAVTRLHAQQVPTQPVPGMPPAPPPEQPPVIDPDDEPAPVIEPGEDSPSTSPPPLIAAPLGTARPRF